MGSVCTSKQAPEGRGKIPSTRGFYNLPSRVAGSLVLSDPGVEKLPADPHHALLQTDESLDVIPRA